MLAENTTHHLHQPLPRAQDSPLQLSSSLTLRITCTYVLYVHHVCINILPLSSTQLQLCQAHMITKTVSISIKCIYIFALPVTLCLIILSCCILCLHSVYNYIRCYNIMQAILNDTINLMCRCLQYFIMRKVQYERNNSIECLKCTLCV